MRCVHRPNSLFNCCWQNEGILGCVVVIFVFFFSIFSRLKIQRTKTTEYSGRVYVVLCVDVKNKARCEWIEMLSTNLILRIYLMQFVVIFGLCLFHCRINAMPATSSIPCDITIEIGARNKLNAEDDARIEQAIKTKLMMLNTRKNHTTTFQLMQVHSMMVRLTVGLMYESIVDIKLNEIVCRCSIKFWVMPWLNANKFQMKCDDDDNNGAGNSSDGNMSGNKQREYHLIEGGLKQMNACEVSDFGDRLASTLQEHEMPTVKRIIEAEYVVVNGYIDLATVELQRPNTNETIECAVEAWQSPSPSIFHDLYIACDTNVYTVLSSLYASYRNRPCIKT